MKINLYIDISMLKIYFLHGLIKKKDIYLNILVLKYCSWVLPLHIELIK